MRTLPADDAAALRRYQAQRRQLRRLDRMERAFAASAALIDQIVADVGDGNDELLATMARRRAALHDARRHRAALRPFVERLHAVSSARVSAIPELAP